MAINYEPYMTWNYLERLKLESHTEIRDAATDFTTKYLALYHLHAVAQNAPELIDHTTIETIQGLLEKGLFCHQRQGMFLYREGAGTLCAVLTRVSDKAVAENALQALCEVLETSTGDAHRACAEAMSDVPFRVRGPRLPAAKIGYMPKTTLPQLMAAHNLTAGGRPDFVGRSLVTPIKSGRQLLVIKLAREHQPPQSLQQEIQWIDHLGQTGYDFEKRFDIPRSLKLGDAAVFRLGQLPQPPKGELRLHPKRYAIGFIADSDYFSYANDHQQTVGLTGEAFQEVILRNAWLLGKMTCHGIVHTAPIPLFHNRTQAHRRRDHGLYEWVRAGRLDRWLASCDYPNLGLSGIRDFEHLISFRGSNRVLYRHIGMHILSLMLVCGSYFRSLDPTLKGWDCDCRPIDARHLFDVALLETLIQGVFTQYYAGFVGTTFAGQIPLDIKRLGQRMIEEMGVDRHMEETLRVTDQEAMSDADFERFLDERGYGPQARCEVIKGGQDLTFVSGPHLGGFNQTNSLPELIEAVSTMAALCIVGRHWSTAYGDRCRWTGAKAA